MIRLFDSLVLVTTDVVLRATNRRLVKKYVRLNGRRPRIADPRRYAERMLWRKLINHDPQFVVFSDKLATKEYCRRICPELALPPTLWIGTDADAIPDELLAGDVFVKTNHGYAFNIEIRNGHVNRQEMKEKTDRWMKSVHGREDCQWAYSQVEPKLFVEQAIGAAAGDLLEINVRASNGTPILGSVIGHNKMSDMWIVYLDTAGNPTAGPNDVDSVPGKHPPDGIAISEPYQRAVEFTKRLSVGVDYARFDFMWNGSDLYAGEITVYPAAGINDIGNASVHAAIIAAWDLSVSHFLTSHHSGLKGVYANSLRRTIQRRASADHLLRGRSSAKVGESREQ